MPKSPEEEQPQKAFGWVARDTSGVLSSFKVSRRYISFIYIRFFSVCIISIFVETAQPLSKPCLEFPDIYIDDDDCCVCFDRATSNKDVTFKVLYCGMCYSGVHSAKNEWGSTVYPLVPGYATLNPPPPSACREWFLLWLEMAEEEDGAAMGTMDGIIDTVSAIHPLQTLIDLLKLHAKLVIVGAPDRPLELPVFPLLTGRKIVAGSSIGGLKEKQEMIDFAGKHNVTADIEVIPKDYVNTAMECLAKSDAKYQFVIDIGNTLNVP
ncbi:hypothetical protein HHK36_030028 [Tetracentron sinense]|uniref:Mannitol dehydrogenase n=1 Tax=Tetracentron sinense TaxID=13715 RepID=A0A834YCE2_TETSI|nr:hypothetical protein HHK36_030028 [Tetracentron sinense]